MRRKTKKKGDFGMKTKKLKEELSKSVLEDEKRIKEIDDSRDRFLETKSMTEKVKAVAELDKAESEKKSNWARFWVTLAGVVTAAFAGAVEVYKARNKDKTNQKILDHEINLMEQYQRNTFDNRGN